MKGLVRERPVHRCHEPPAAAQRRWSALTGQSLYYLGRDELRNKVLAVAEEEGFATAARRLPGRRRWKTRNSV